MSKKQHGSLNELLNSVVSGGGGVVRFARERHVDSFYTSHNPEGPSEKVRVTRDRAGHHVASVVKTRIADLNVHSPGEVFDWRISLNTETPVEFDEAGRPPGAVREKDRAVYTGDTCRVDLTFVRTHSKGHAAQAAQGQPQGEGSTSYELEIEVLDAPRLIAEGDKEARGEPNVFDDVLQSVLDTARMIIRNV